MKNPERICIAIAVFCILALAWMAWTAGSAKADGACKSLQDFKSGIMPKMPPGSTLSSIEPKSIPAFVKMFNALPPASNLEGDEVEIVTIPNDQNHVVLLFNKGCFVVFQRVNPSTFEMLIGAES